MQSKNQIKKSPFSRLHYIWAVFKVELDMLAAYRFRLVVWILSGLVEPLVWCVLWYATAKYGAGLTYSTGEVLVYYLFVALVSRITKSWSFDKIKLDVWNGDYSKYLLWPRGVIGYRIGSDWANRVLSVVTLLPIWLVLLGLTISGGLIRFDLLAFILALPALVISIYIAFFLDMILGHFIIWIGKGEGIDLVYQAANRILSGRVVPLSFLPLGLFTFAKLLPFRYDVSFPIEIAMGKLTSSEIVMGFSIGTFWLIVQ